MAAARSSHDPDHLKQNFESFCIDGCSREVYIMSHLFPVLIQVCEFLFTTHCTSEIRISALKLLREQKIRLQCKYFGFFSVISNTHCSCLSVLLSHYTYTYFSLKLIILYRVASFSIIC